MKTFVAIIKTDSKIEPKERIAFGAHDYCDFVRQLNNHASACYYDWELLKYWTL